MGEKKEGKDEKRRVEDSLWLVEKGKGKGRNG